MKVVFLTSSRADYSIYRPLLLKMMKDSYFEVSAIVFGTHTSELHGYTIQNIIDDSIPIECQEEIIVLGDTPQAINSSIGLAITKFSSIWSARKFDLIIALGDRYEMFAAVISTLPYNLPVAHLHGGETTLGAFDNVYRHSISLTSKYHFVSTSIYKTRLVNLLNSDENIFNVGALSVENINSLDLYSSEIFFEEFDVDLSLPTILCTFHPETVSYEKNEFYIDELISAITSLEKYQFLVTLPNNDTMGNHIRNKLKSLSNLYKNIICVDNLGTIGYLSAMKYAILVLGNSSSGFVEASVFPKKVINIGDRQKGRILTSNIYSSIIKKENIINTINKALNDDEPTQSDVYGNGDTSNLIISQLKKITNKK